MDITDWFPTILDMGKCDERSKKSLDGVSQFAHIWHNDPLTPPRDEILHALNPLKKISSHLKDPRPFSTLNGRMFSPKMRSAIRYNKWKLITGQEATEHNFKYRPPKFQTNFTEFVVLYDMSEDPAEETDVSDMHPEIVGLLLTKLADYYVSL